MSGEPKCFILKDREYRRGLLERIPEKLPLSLNWGFSDKNSLKTNRIEHFHESTFHGDALAPGGRIVGCLVMTEQEQRLADDKARAEIAKLIAETAKTLEEAAKIRRERFWIPFTIATGLMAAILTLLPRLFT